AGGSAGCGLDRRPARSVRCGSRIERLLLPFGQETPLDASLATVSAEAQLRSLSPRAGERVGVRGEP
ncbi:MAG: hypothetical protein ABI682_11305, partial [Acidobacteriota bacterium]